jgi:hypothetical protein
MVTYRNGNRSAISGASLAQLRRRMSAAERAVLAAEIVDGRIVLQGLTVKAIAALVGACPAYVHRALNLTSAQRGAVLAGERPLVPQRTRKGAPTADWWESIDDDALVDMIRGIGLDRTLDAAVEAEHFPQH